MDPDHQWANMDNKYQWANIDPDYRGLIEATASLFQSDKYSDLTITCGSEIFKVHRAVVCPRSKFFAAACDGRFKEGITSEIALPEDDPETVQRMLSFLYRSDYDDELHTIATDGLHAVAPVGDTESIASMDSQPEKQTPFFHGGWRVNDAPLFSAIHVYAIADKYDIPDLKRFARSRFQDWALKGIWLRKDFPAIIRAVFELTPDDKLGLREIVTWYFYSNGQDIGLYQKGKFFSELQDQGDFWLGVVKLGWDELQDSREEVRRLKLQASKVRGSGFYTIETEW
ncbi:MAG: hypothetical protein M1839_006326 [Geoglossum umbratile]|nr:MAG: hypothetical protein M1839_006326 [Geoglossum umbratile]